MYNIDQNFQQFSTQKWFKEKSMDEQGAICIEAAKRRDYEIRFLPNLTKEQSILICDCLNTFGNIDIPADNDTIKYFNVDYVFECLIEAWRQMLPSGRHLIKSTIDLLVASRKYYQAGRSIEEIWLI